MRRKIRIAFICMCVGVLVFASSCWAITITEPKPGTVFSPGDTVKVKVDLLPSEKAQAVFIRAHKISGSTLDFVPPYELEFTIDKHFTGETAIAASAKLLDGTILEAEVPITVVLPPSTTVVSIGAAFSGTGEEAFLNIARKQNGEFIVTEGTTSTNRISVGATYSDGVEREITENPDVTYESLDEKVAIMLPHALVKATGPGETEIVVRYQGHESNVTVHVRECPYIEGKTEKEGCP